MCATGATAIARAICSGATPKFEDLDLNDNTIGELQDDGGLPEGFAAAFSKSVQQTGSEKDVFFQREGRVKSSPLKRLVLGDNSLMGIMHLLTPLADHCLTALEVLDLKANRLGDSEIIAFAEVVADSSLPALQELNLANTMIESEGCIALAKALGEGTLRALKELNLSDNEIEPSGAKALADALKRGSLMALAELRLENCGLREEGTSAIAEAVCHKAPALHCLDLKDNRMGCDGATALANALIARPLRVLVHD